jgi:lipid II:glycine glycyltransferase (peptidoglycan interpeptide bridge formation enzyme)
MTIRLVKDSEKAAFDAVATHPLQSWAWGDFRHQLGQQVVRLGGFAGSNMKWSVQMTIHHLPRLPWTIGYVPRGPLPNKSMLQEIRHEAARRRAIFVKFEPNVVVNPKSPASRKMKELGLRPGKEIFTPYTFQVDLDKSDDELLAQMKSKTRYNIRLAERKGVTVKQDNSEKAFAIFQQLTEETTHRQKFFAHDRRYRKLMWQTLRQAGIARMLVARYQQEILAIWILFFFNRVGYYPYGASSTKHRQLMASNLLAWRAMQLARKQGCQQFDFWGSLGPDPDQADPWFGFHRFKAGYGGELVQLVGTWDLVINPWLYPIYQQADQLRWKWLRLRNR